MRLYLGLYGCRLYISRQQPSDTEAPEAQAAMAAHLSGLCYYFMATLRDSPFGGFRQNKHIRAGITNDLLLWIGFMSCLQHKMGVFHLGVTS